MPVEFLTDEQAAAYGRFVEESTRPELERFFFLDDVDRDLIALRRTTAHQLGFAVQLAAGQMPLRPLLRGLADAAALVQKPANVMHRRPKRPPHRTERLSFTPASPDLVLLSRRKPVATHLCLHDHMIIRGCLDHLRVPSFDDT
ncbi:DUF4158 domain-containing protein [Streptomyces sp. NPDC059679]|uniref:DUF4158 domain-containing protein n=1 Tax=Streptomyces sp. NPDC059679 TaxID=3346903 RepID=UPI0036AAC9D8